MIEPILAEHDPPKRGSKRIDQRRALDAVIFRVRSGCQWNRPPKKYPDDSSVHRTFQRWVGLGIFDRIWAVVQEACEDGWPQHLCLDKGYDNEDGSGACIDHEDEPHIALIRDERPPRPKPHKPRR